MNELEDSAELAADLNEAIQDDLHEAIEEDIAMSLEETREKEGEEHLEEINQLLVDETVTTLISSKKKSANALTKPYKKVFSVPTKSFCEKLDKRSISNELLPRNSRYYVSGRRGSILVLEEEPSIRSINVEYDFESVIENLKVTGKLEEFGFENFLQGDKHKEVDEDGKVTYRFTLSFPYVVYVILLYPNPQSLNARVSVFYRNAPLTSLQDQLFKTNLLNVDGRCLCCMGEVEMPKGCDLNTRVNTLIDSFWNSTFNREIRECYNSYQENPHLSSFLHWQYYSDKDPMFIMSEELMPSNYTVALAISSISGEEGMKILDSYKSIVDILMNQEYSRNEGPSLYAVNQMPLLKSGIVLDSGEEVTLYNKKYFVVDFLRNDISFEKIRLETEDSDVTTIDLNASIIRSLASQIKRRKYLDSITVKGQEVKAGKIITFSGPEWHTTVVRKILKERDGGFLTKCGNDYYLLENIDFEVFDQNQVKVRGQKLELGKKYLIIGPQSEHIPFFYRSEASSSQIYNGFQGTGIDDDSECVSLKFGDDSFLRFEELNDYNLFPEDAIEKLEVARHGRRLFENCSMIKGTGLFSKSIRSLSSTTINRLVNEILTKQELVLRSYDFDIKFSVGDKVVIPDWSNSETVTQIRTITGFRVSPSNSSVDIITTGVGDHSISHTEYLNFTDGTKVNVGSVRKISEEFGGIKAGFKVVAKVRGVQNFMKKDCYQVVGFLTDTANGVPLMLCSNLCTIWCTKKDLEKFDFLEPGSYGFSRLQLTEPILSSVAFQPGDLIFSNRARTRCCEDRVLLLVTKPSFGQTLSVVRPDNGVSCRCYKDVVDLTTFFGIPSPRVKMDPKVLRESEDFEKIAPYPGFHNTIFDITNRNRSNIKIYVRREEKYNVSDLFSG